MATKSVSSFAVFVILFLVIFEMPEIEGQDSECLKEYTGQFFHDDMCFIGVLPPTSCYVNCRFYKASKGGRCIWNKDYAGGVKCFCDHCNATLIVPTPSEMREIIETQHYPKCTEEYVFPSPCAFVNPTAVAECARRCDEDKRPKTLGCLWGQFDPEGNLECSCRFCKK